MGELLRPAKNLEIFVRLRILDDAEVGGGTTVQPPVVAKRKVVSMDGHHCFDSPTQEGSASVTPSQQDPEKLCQ